MKIGLIACSKRKQTYSCSAREMYSKSPLFRKAFAYCQKYYDRVYILSAKYGLLNPETVIDPYDLDLSQIAIKERKEWAKNVATRLKKILKRNDRIYFHVGIKYREFLLPEFEDRSFVPLAGLSIGKQLQFYENN